MKAMSKTILIRGSHVCIVGNTILNIMQLAQKKR
jgi:hypothetical protein